jgi:hypothetical protein
MPTLLRPSVDNKADVNVEPGERQEELHQDVRPVEEWPKQVEQLPTENPPEPSQSSSGSSDADGPRKIGRQRTGTMVFSEGFVVTEELAKDADSCLSELGPVDPQFFELALPIQTPPPTLEDLTLSQSTDDVSEPPEKDASVDPADVATEQATSQLDRPDSPPLNPIDPEPENYPALYVQINSASYVQINLSDVDSDDSY